MNYAFGILIYYRQKSIIMQKIYIKYKNDHRQNRTHVLCHTTLPLYPTLPVLTKFIEIFKIISQFTEYLQYFSEIYSKFASMS